MSALRGWLRVVGTLYLLMFLVAAVLGVPIREEGPPGTLELAAAGDPLARFVVDTWVTFGLVMGATGVALWIASRAPSEARVLVLAVSAIELGLMVADVYKIGRGLDSPAPYAWLAIHATVIATGLLALRRARSPSGGEVCGGRGRSVSASSRSGVTPADR